MGCCHSKVSDDDSKRHANQLEVLRWPAGSSQAGSSQSAANGIEKVEPTSAVKVAVVVRPLQPFEIQAGAKDIVTVLPPSKVALPQRPSNGPAPGECYEFSFDRVYRADGAAASARLHDEVVKKVLDRFCQGFNGTILAYGQTGSGKTYTMGTAASAKDLAAATQGGGVSGAAGGVVPRSIHRVFEYIAHASEVYDADLTVTYVEIYNEQVYDLLAPSGPPISCGGHGSSNSLSSAHSTGGAAACGSGPSFGGAAACGGLAIREGPDGSISLEGATEARARCAAEVAALIARGNERRAVGSHKLNEWSSRSHAVLTVALEQRARPGAACVPRELRYLRSKLSLVDLAGSERAKQTGTTGARFQEGVAINSGLLALGNVINALSEQQRTGGGGGGQGPGRRHVPYRDSKLTRLLQDGLGGNSETLFLACVSPADASHEHSVGTLRYASRAMSITNSLQLNAMAPEEEVVFLRAQLEAALSEVADLREEVAKLQARASDAPER